MLNFFIFFDCSSNVSQPPNNSCGYLDHCLKKKTWLRALTPLKAVVGFLSVFQPWRPVTAGAINQKSAEAKVFFV